MTTLIFSDKPSVTRAILPFLPPELASDDTYVVHMLYLGPARAQFTRGRPLSAYPLVETPRYQLEKTPRFDALPIQAYASKESYGAAKAIPVPELLPAVTRIIYAIDPDHSGMWAFRSSLELWAGAAAARQEYEAWNMTAMDDASIRKAIAAGRSGAATTANLSAVDNYGRTKRYFEYQWLNNSHVVLGAALRSVGCEGRLPSKFGLQFLFAMQDATTSAPQGTLGTEGQCVALMHRWPGSGKYPKGEMGSAASRGEIIEQLKQAGLIARLPIPQGSLLPEWQGPVVLTKQGAAFLAALHPDCKDVDLPQRLDSWCKAGLEASKPAIDRYIRTFFGKQLRFAAGRAKGQGAAA